VQLNGEETRRFRRLLELYFDYEELLEDQVVSYAVHWCMGNVWLDEDEERRTRRTRMI
jgi:hypothetical protein